MIAVTLAIELFLMNLVGYFARKMGIVTKEFPSQVTSLLLKICVPCLVFRSVSRAVPFSLSALKQCGIVLLIAACVLALSFALGQACYVLSRRSGFARVIRFALLFTHYSFMGIPIIQTLFGDTGMFYYSFFLIPIRIAYYSLSEPIMVPPDKDAPRLSFSEILRSTLLNPCLIAMILGLIFWVAGWQLPAVPDYVVSTLSGITSPLALILCGMILAEYDIRSLLHVKYLAIPALRTILMPLLALLLIQPLKALGVDEMVCQITVIYAALPIASLLPVYTMRLDPDPEDRMVAASACAFSVLMALVTVPVFYTLIAV